MKMRGVLVISLLLLTIIILSSCVEQRQVPQQAPQVPVIELAEDEYRKAQAEATGIVHEVVIENLQFMPTDIIINAGDTVEGINKDSIQDNKGNRLLINHILTVEECVSDMFLSPGTSGEYTFLTQGVYRYVSKYQMEDFADDDKPDDRERVLQGTVIVQNK